ncbi:Zn-dependent protease (includes SpoIVFB) [Geodermatophilus dictyosporus]|uniref:Zinc metalloprotease n=1 Tax=Geodermatophilus dictyosporus TaxID=1523247 RepID=A0A1I5QJC6_9ACTN|nr:site-2 protease family protein [Geodermatophilus dictyosporus]SFP46359.1 Zn-dependent protease (includes SpoIVFB) [Geodermatophilus dictyosporus]
MTETFRLGRIAGIRVGVNASVLVIVLIIAVGLATGRFPLVLPGRSGLAYAAAALAAALAFLVSLLAHELAHALVARRNGVEVEGITLWLLGGVARLRGGARTPGAEFRIAGVGPLTSLVLSGAFAAAAVLARASGADGLPVAVLDYLAVINLSLALFNLVPASPLDGGRLLRALLWWRRGDPWSSAVTASRAGRFLGFVLIALGALQLVTGSGLGGLWLGLIGLFLVNAASAEEQHAAVSGRLAGLTVGQVMGGPVLVADPDQPVEQFLHEVALVHRFSTYPLVDRTGALTGLVTLNRLRSVPGDARATTRLGDVACPLSEIPVSSPGDPLLDLLGRMEGCSDGRAVVLDGGRVVGVVSPSDVTRLLQLTDLAAFARHPSAGGGADVSRVSYPGPR